MGRIPSLIIKFDSVLSMNGRFGYRFSNFSLKLFSLSLSPSHFKSFKIICKWLCNLFSDISAKMHLTRVVYSILKKSIWPIVCCTSTSIKCSLVLNHIRSICHFPSSIIINEREEKAMVEWCVCLHVYVYVADWKGERVNECESTKFVDVHIDFTSIFMDIFCSHDTVMQSVHL